MRLFVPAGLVALATACVPGADLFGDTDLSESRADSTDPVDTVETAVSEVPVAICSADPTSVTLGELTEVLVTGADSYDPMGHALQTYTWNLVVPDGSGATLMPSEDSSRRLTPDLLGAYVVSLVVTTDDGRASEPCEVTVTAEAPSYGIVVDLGWTQSGDDLDLHLLAPGGTVTSQLDCYYANRQPEWGVAGLEDNPSLELDDIPGTGPEKITYALPPDGVYQVVVRDYPNSVNNTPNDAVVTITVYGVPTTFTPTLTTEGTYYYIAMIDIPSGDVLACSLTGC